MSLFSPFHVQLFFLAASSVTYSNFRSSMKCSGNSSPLTSSSTTTIRFAFHPYNKPFIPCHLPWWDSVPYLPIQFIQAICSWVPSTGMGHMSESVLRLPRRMSGTLLMQKWLAGRIPLWLCQRRCQRPPGISGCSMLSGNGRSRSHPRQGLSAEVQEPGGWDTGTGKGKSLPPQDHFRVLYRSDLTCQLAKRKYLQSPPPPHSDTAHRQGWLWSWEAMNLITSTVHSSGSSVSTRTLLNTFELGHNNETELCCHLGRYTHSPSTWRISRIIPRRRDPQR